MNQSDQLGFMAPSEVWMQNARCKYGNCPHFLGEDMDGVSKDEHQRLVDKNFLNDHDSRWSSGDESKGLAKAIQECLGCPVRTECLRYAADPSMNISYGVFGGTTHWERKTVMSNDFLPGLGKEARLRMLEALVAAKTLGWAELSVPLDRLNRKVKK